MKSLKALAGQHEQTRQNAEFWERGETLRHYASRELRPVEALLLDRFHGALTGSVLELGCGAGRLTGHLSEIAREVHGVDISPAMVAYCQKTYPRATFAVGDLRELSGFQTGSYEAVVAPFNVIDVLDDRERVAALEQIRRIVADGGLFVMSSHNRAFEPRIPASVRVWIGSPRTEPLESIRRLPRRLGNRRRLRPREREESGYAIVNDEAHDFAVLHYYITRDTQARQLAEQGFEFVECLDLDGRPVNTGGTAKSCPELHYVARRVARR